jgi:hypothetical protein
LLRANVFDGERAPRAALLGSYRSLVHLEATAMIFKGLENETDTLSLQPPIDLEIPDLAPSGQ